MKRIVSNGIQIILFVVLAVSAYLFWAEREFASAMLEQWSGSAETNGSKGGRKHAEGVTVIAEPATVEVDAPTVLAVGTARATQAVNIVPEVSGKVVSIDVRSGQYVEAGQVLTRIDDRQALIAVKIAETKLGDARLNLARAKQLKEKNVKSAAFVEDAELLLERTELELGQARETLADHVIKAPFSGYVGLRKMEPGDRVTDEMAIMTLDDRKTLYVEFDVPEQHVADVKVGTKVEGKTPGFRDRVFEGQVSRVDSRVDTLTRTIRVRASFANEDDALRPGMSFAVTVELPGKSFSSVPELAVQWDNQGSYVWQVVDGLAKKQPVSVVRRSSGRVLLEGSVGKGDLVVVEGVQRLREGRKVQFRDRLGKSKAGPSAYFAGDRVMDAS